MTGSLTTATNYVADVLGAIDGSAAPFVPEQVDFGTFAFVSWLRTGAAAGGLALNAATSRAEVTAKFDVVPDSGQAKTVQQKIALYGPGDVIGFATAQVIRCEPEVGAHVAAGGTLAHIEFDDPALPWAFSPVAVANGDLQPWVALVVVPADKAELSQGLNGSPPLLRVGAEQLPTAAEAWAWAHAQVPGKLNAQPALAVRLGEGHGPQNLSRLICPRRLAANTAYLACVVPTFEIGALAGRDLAGGTLSPAWPASGPAALPVYHSWTFSTGEMADFEQLAQRLKAVKAPAGIGRRTIDISRPGGPIADAPGARQIMKCALYSPQEPPASELALVKDWPAASITKLRDEVGQGLATAVGDLPRVSPRAYGRFQRGLAAMSGSATDWFDQLNTRPVDRIAAGVGTRVVRRDADKLVEAAWNQAGEVEQANVDVIDPAQFGRFVAEAIVKVGEDRMDPGPLMQLTNPVQGKIGWGANRTLAGEIEQSALPRTATSAAFRRLTAPGGRLARSVVQAGGEPAAFRTLVATPATRTIPAVIGDMRLTYQEPAAIAGLTPAMLARIPAARARAVLGEQWQQRLGGSISSLDGLGRAPGREVPVDIGQFEAGWRARGVEKVLAQGAALTPGMKEALGGEIARILPGAAPATARRLRVTLDELAAAVPEEAASAPAAIRPAPTRPGAFQPATPAKPVVLGGATARGGFSAQPARRNALERFAAFGVRRAPVRAAGQVVSAKALRAGLAAMFRGSIAGLGKTPGRPRAAITREAILAAVAPRRLAKHYMEARLDLPPRYAGWFDDGLVTSLIVEGPSFDRPMFEALLDYDRDWLVPGLGLIQEDNFVTLLVSNARFIESFMVGLSDEMSRELLWRHYPSDPRATAFRRFWSPAADELQPDIHKWKANERLSAHFLSQNGPDGAPADRVVLMIRGELIRKIPHAIVVAQRGQVTKDGAGNATVQLAAPPGPGMKGAPLFRASLANDTVAVGFDLTVQDIDQPGGAPWCFIIAEHPGAPRFGLDLDVKAGAGPAPDDLDWSDPPVDVRAGVGTFLRATQANIQGWGTNSATHARLLMQSPARVVIEAKKLVENIGKAG